MKHWKYILLIFLAVGLWAPLNGQIAQVMDDFLHATGATETDPDPLPWAQTWNDGSDTFVGFQMDITDTASAAGSLLMDLQVGSTTLFSVGKTGIINTAVGLDGIGAVDIDIGSADITDVTFVTDGTGTAEIVLPAGSIDGTEILDATIGTADLSAAVKTESETYLIWEPDSKRAISDDIVLKKFIAEKYPSGVTITSIHIDAASAYTAETMLFEHWDDAAGSTQATVESIACSAISTEDDGTLTDATIPADYFLVLNFDDTPEDVDYVAITVSYTY